MVLRIHPVADLTFAQAAPTREPAPETAKISDAAKYVPPTREVLDLMVAVRSRISPGSWETPAHISGQGRNLVVYQTPEVQHAVASYLQRLRVDLQK